MARVSRDSEDRYRGRPEPLDLISPVEHAASPTSGGLFSPGHTFAANTTAGTTFSGVDRATLTSSVSPPLLSPSSLRVLSPSSLRIMTENLSISPPLITGASGTTTLPPGGLGLTNTINTTITSISEEAGGLGDSTGAGAGEATVASGSNKDVAKQQSNPVTTNMASTADLADFLSSPSSSRLSLNIIATITEDLNILFSKGAIKLMLEGAIHLSTTGLDREAKFQVHLIDSASQIGHKIANKIYLTELAPQAMSTTREGSSEGTSSGTDVIEGGGEEEGRPILPVATGHYACRLPKSEHADQQKGYVPALRYRTIPTLRPIPVRLQSKFQFSTDRTLLRILAQVIIKKACWNRGLCHAMILTLIMLLPHFPLLFTDRCQSSSDSSLVLRFTHGPISSTPWSSVSSRRHCLC